MRLARHTRWIVAGGLLLLAGVIVWFPAWKLPRAIPALVLAVAAVVVLTGPGGKSKESDG